MKKQFVTIFSSIFIVLSIAIYALHALLPAYRFALLEAGNTIMFGLSMGTAVMVTGQIGKSPYAFVRGVSGASLLKLMVCLGAIFAYIVLNRDSLHKQSIFALFGIYAIYAAAEALLLSKMARTSE